MANFTDFAVSQPPHDTPFCFGHLVVHSQPYSIGTVNYNVIMCHMPSVKGRVIDPFHALKRRSKKLPKLFFATMNSCMGKLLWPCVPKADVIGKVGEKPLDVLLQ